MDFNFSGLSINDETGFYKNPLFKELPGLSMSLSDRTAEDSVG